MPLYQYRCPECTRTVERFREVALRDTYRSCCTKTDQMVDMQRVLTPAHLHGSENMPNG